MADKRFIHKKNIDESLILLDLVVDILDRNKITYYLDFGTLLGAVRDNRLIRWDNNINISLLNEYDYEKLPDLFTKLSNNGYAVDFIRFNNKSYLSKGKYFAKKIFKAYLSRNIWTIFKKIINEKFMKTTQKVHKSNPQDIINFNKNSYKECNIVNKNTHMKIFFKYEYKKNLYWKILYRTKKMPIELISADLVEITLYDTKYKVPKNYNLYLSYLYGDWETPNKEYKQEDGVAMVFKDRREYEGDRKFIHKKNKDAMIALLKIVISVFEKHDIEYYLDMGTLLGAVREDGLMDWDDDVDISLVNEKDFLKIPNILNEISDITNYITRLYTIKQSQTSYSKSIDKYVEPKKIEFTDINNYHIAKIRNRAIYVPNEINIVLDIFFQYQYKNYIHWFMFGKVYKVPSSSLNTGFKKIDFHGVSCNIPNNYDIYLQHIFGKDWKIPNKNWIEDQSPAMDNNYRGQIKQDNRLLDKKNSDAMISLFKLVDKVLRRHKVEYYLDFGTLLGAVRENKFIPWDDDMDISLIHEKDFNKMPKIIKEIKLRRFWYFAKCYSFSHSQDQYNASEKMHVNPKEIKFTNPKNMQIAIIKNYIKWRPGLGNAVMDIFCKYNYKGNIYWMAFGKEYKMAYAPLEKGFKEIEFYGVKCLIPIAYDEYLSGHYGEWNTPSKAWDQKDSNAMTNEYRN